MAENCEANVIVVENDQQLQKILKIRDQLPHLKAIVQYSGELKEKYDKFLRLVQIISVSVGIIGDQKDVRN